MPSGLLIATGPTGASPALCPATQAELVLHLLLLWDRLPAVCLACGVAAQVSYLRLLKPYPYIQLTSPNGLASIALWLASTGLWVRHFMGTLYTGGRVGAMLGPLRVAAHESPEPAGCRPLHKVDRGGCSRPSGP